MLAAEVLNSVEMGIVLLGVTVLVGPVVAERLRVPGLIGLIGIGMLLGPSVLEWLRPGGFVATVGLAGLLYLMFLAGVELDLKTFVANRAAAFTFGALTFVVPFVLSVAMAFWWLDFTGRAAALIGAMWASHTVVAYPEAKAAGLDRSRAVGVAVAATVITDVAALVVLAVAASGGSHATDTTGGHEDSVLPLWLGLVLVTVFCLVVLPRVTGWVFERLFTTRTQRFMWLLTGMAGGAAVGLLGGIEGLVGAFLAGIGMNRSVPARSELMERVEFVGNALLVPAFLVSVGMSIDPRALVEPDTLLNALVFTAVILVGKSVPALISGRLFGYSAAETAIMFTLTIGQAAATLAIARVGTAAGLFEQDILDAAVVTVVFTVFMTSFGTRFAARRITQTGDEAPALGEHVLVLAPRAEVARSAASLVTAIARPDGGLVTPFVAATTDAADSDDHTEALHAFEQALTQCGADTHPVTRVGVSLHTATATLAREVAASVIVLSVDSSRFPLGIPIADDVDAIGAESPVPCIAARVSAEPRQRIVVLTGTRRDPVALADLELTAEVARRVVAVDGLPLVVLAPDPGQADRFREIGDATVVGYRARSGDALDHLAKGDLLIAPAHIAGEAGLLARARLQSALRGVSVLLVGGPGRLRVSLGREHPPLMGAVSQKAAG